jgi:hypothetical protein
MEKVLLALFSVAVGALLGGGVNALVGRYSAFKEGQAVAAALRAELEAMLAIGEARDHAKRLERTIIHLRKGTGVPAKDDFYETLGDPKEAYLVFRANCDKVGLLGLAAEPVVAAYVRYIALDQDLAGIPQRHGRQPLTRPQLIEAHEAMLELLLDATTRAKTAITKLREHERRHFVRWKRSI